MIELLSLGAGVQSSTLLLMSLAGQLPRLDHVIFADTQWEPEPVYSHLDWLEGLCQEAGVAFHRVTAGSIREDLVSKYPKAGTAGRYGTAPFYTANPDGSEGMVRRTCTDVFKVTPIERFVKGEILGLGRRQRWPREPVISQWFGISIDEIMRIKLSNQAWKIHRFPLCNYPEKMLPKAMSRQDCVAWIGRHHPTRTIPKSACIGCPFHSDGLWREMKRNRPHEFEDACEVDDAIRSADQMDGESFLHRKRVPLRVIDFEKDVDQATLWEEHGDCSGYCGS